MLTFSMSVSIDGFINDRNGDFGWSAPSDEQFQFQLERIRELGACLCGRRLYETMLVWETDPSFREMTFGNEFADVWSELPKVVFSRTLTAVNGNARLARGSLAEEIAATVDVTEKDVEIGGACLAAQAFELGLIDELQLFRVPIVVGGGTPALPAVTEASEFELLESRTFGSRVLFERYRRVSAVRR